MPNKTTTVILRSSQRTSGTANDASVYVNWAKTLPEGYEKFRLTSSFITVGGNYNDYVAGGTNYFKTGAYVQINIPPSTLGADLDTRQYTTILGTAERKYANLLGNTPFHYLSYDVNSSVPLIINRPSNTLVNVEVVNVNPQNGGGIFLTQTNAALTGEQADMSDYTLILHFECLDEKY